MTSITGGGGSCSDFLSLQNLASSEQFSFSSVFFRMRVSGSRHLYSLLVVSLLLLNGKSSFNYFGVTEKGFV